jgi:hypothetical protein
MYGKDYTYAATRLNGTIVRLKDGEPFTVHSIDAGGMAVGVLMKDGLVHNYHLDDLDVHPIRLGYINHERGGTSYIRRMPLRRDWKQGLRSSQCVSNNINLNHIPSSDLRKTVLGQFIPFNKAIQCNFSVAFHRHWAVSRKKLYYKNRLVGHIEKDVPILAPENQYLKEYLQGCIK